MKVRHVMEKSRAPVPLQMPGRHVVDTTVRLPGATPKVRVPAADSVPSTDPPGPRDPRDERLPPDYFLG
jgi:hypothetical protein